MNLRRSSVSKKIPLFFFKKKETRDEKRERVNVGFLWLPFYAMETFKMYKLATKTSKRN